MQGSQFSFSDYPRRSLEERGWREKRLPRPERLHVIFDPEGSPTKTKVMDETGEVLAVTKLEIRLAGNQMTVADIERLAIVNDWQPGEAFTYWDRDLPVTFEAG